MNRRKLVRLACLFIANLTLCPAAQAALFRAYLASDGSDANACTLQAPCRLLPAALTAVADGGEIWMLDSANYNTAQVSITKSVTILAIPGALGSVLAASGNAINILTPGVKVTLRNLVIVPLPGGGGGNGITLNGGERLTVDNCLIANLPGAGIVVVGGSVRVTDTTIRDNGSHGMWILAGAGASVTRATISGNADTGIYVFGSTASTVTTADIAASTLDGNLLNGVAAYSNNATAVVRVSVRDSQSVRSPGYGFGSQSDAGASVTLSVSSNIISNNGVGIQAAFTGSTVWATGNTVSDNVTGFVQSGGSVFESASNNAVRNNGTDTNGTISPVATK